MALTDPQIIKAANVALNEVAPAIDMFKQFAFDASEEFATPGETVKIPVASVGTLSAFNASTNNFEDNDGTITWYPITLDTPIKATWEVKASDITKMPVGNYLNTFAKASADKIQYTIGAKLGDLFDAADADLSANKQTLSDAADMTLADFAALRSLCNGRVGENCLVLDTEYYSKLLSLVDNSVIGTADAVVNGYIQKLLGFSAVVEAPQLKNGTKGAIIPKSNLVIASRNFQVADEGCYSEYGYQADPETGFSITMMKHGSAATGSGYLNSVALFGIALIKKGEVVVLV